MNINNIKTTIKEHVGEELFTLVDFALDMAPYLGELNQSRKINRAERRIQEHLEQLSRIQKLFASEILSKEFVQEQIGPIILSDLIEEHEDAKIQYLLNGFENVFINECTDESLILNYFDTLRDLRYADLKSFFFYSAISDYPPLNRKEDPNLIGLAQQIYFKLERLYLVKSPVTWESLEVGAESLPEERRNVELTLYGIGFVKFIFTDFNEQMYQEKISKYSKDDDNGLGNIQGGTF